MHKFYAHIGSALLGISIAGLIFSYTNAGLIPAISLALLWLGISFILDYFLFKNFGYYILPAKKSQVGQFLVIALLSIFFCYILEFAGLYATRLWYWKEIPFKIYFLASPITYLIYPLVLFQLYELVKHMLKHQSYPLKVSESLYNQIMNVEFIVGVIFFITWITYALGNIQRLPIPFLEIRLSSGIQVPWWFGFIAMLSIFLFFEWLGFTRKRNTLTHDLLRGDLRPILAVLLSATLGILIMEIVNAPLQIWTYDNWPLQNIQIFTVPILVIFLWPVQFLAFLAIFSSFLDKKKSDIW